MKGFLPCKFNSSKIKLVIDMGNLLVLLRKSHKLEKDQVAAQLDLSVEEYTQMESEGHKLTSAQAELLSELYNIEARHLLAESNPVVNYNIGTYSRGITNVQNYYEGLENNPSE